MKLAAPACSPQSAREARSPHVDFCAVCPGTPISRLAPGLATQPRQLFSVPLPARSLFTLFTIQNSSDLDPAMQNATPVSPFRMNTCKSVSKQRTLTTFRMNTYEKPRGGGRVPLLRPVAQVPSSTLATSTTYLLVQEERAVVQAGSTPHLLDVCDHDLRHFLREVECGSQVAADKPHVARDILRELGFAGLVRKQAVHLDLRRAGNRGHLSLPLAAMLEAVHVAVQDHEVVGVGCSRVAVAVHVLELVCLSHLFDQVLVQRQLKFNGKLHFIGLHRQNLDRGRLNLCGRLVLRQCRASREQQHYREWQQGAQIADQLHCFFSFAFPCASASPSTGTLVLAPWLSKAFLALSALPCGRVKIAPCMPPEGSRYSIESVSILLRNRLRNLPPPYGANIVSVPTVPPMARSVSLPVITSWIEAAGTTTFFFPFVNTRDPFSATSVPLTLCFKPSSPMTCFVSAND